jgi:hypothetical protein
MNKNTHIFELELSTRANNALLGYSVYEYENNTWKHESLDTIGKVIEKSETDLLRAANLGRKSLNEIIYALDQHGFKLLNYKENVKLPKKIPMRELNLRDYFAAKAMQGLLTHEWLYLYDKAEKMSLESAEDYVVETSYFVADLMMKARKE